jgi:Chromosome segregation ATPases
MRRLRLPLWVASLLAAAVCAVLAWRQYRIAADLNETIARLEQENQHLRAEAARMAGETASLRARLGEETDERKRPEGDSMSDDSDVESRLDAIRIISSLKDELAAAKRSIAEMQNQILELQADIDRTTEENKKLIQAEAELRESLSSAQRVIEAMQTELKGKNDRLVQLEIAARRNAEDLKVANERIKRVTAWSEELEDIQRRREVHLANLARRYRDLNDRLREMALRLDNPQESTRPLSMDLSRVQTVIQSAEEDLRQLAALNSQVQTLQRKLRN